MTYDLIGRLVVASVAIGLAMLGAVCVAVYVLLGRAAREFDRMERMKREAEADSAAPRVVVVLATDDGDDPDDVRVH